MIIEVKLENDKMERLKIREKDDKYFVSFMDREHTQEFEADLKECGHFYSVIIENKPYLVKFVEEGSMMTAVSGPYMSKVKAENQEIRIRREIRETFSVSVSTMETKIPGKMLDVMVKPGDEVNRGDQLFILEAMKMENRIFAPRHGVIKEVMVNKGDILMTGDKLLTFEDAVN